MTHITQWPGTPEETKFAEFLVRETGGHFVTILRTGCAPELGVRIPGQTVDVKRMLEAAISTDVEPVGYFVSGGCTSDEPTFFFYHQKNEDYWRDMSFTVVPLYAAPPAPSVAVKALKFYAEYFDDEVLGDLARDALSALSAQVQDAPPAEVGMGGAIKALTENQRQLDADGCEVGVSREALELLLEAYRRSRRTVYFQLDTINALRAPGLEAAAKWEANDRGE